MERDLTHISLPASTSAAASSVAFLPLNLTLPLALLPAQVKMFGGCFYSVRLSTLAMGSVTMVAAQNLAIPSTWANATTSLDKYSRAVLASNAASSMYNRINPLDKLGDVVPRVQYFSSFFSVLAMQDYYSGNSSWDSAVVNGLQGYYQQRGVYGGSPELYSDSVYWGLTFFYAYRVYKQQFLLDIAVSIHNTTYVEAFITSSIAASGLGAGRNVTFAIPSNCTNSFDTIAGGIFFNKDERNTTSITAATVVPFMALSAYLFEQTGDPLYQQTAQLSLEFILNHLWNGTVVTGGFNYLNACELSTILYTENQGWFIEGLSVWANVTRNSTVLSLHVSILTVSVFTPLTPLARLEVVVPSVATFPAWTLANGVISEGSNISDSNSDAISKGIFIRGLAEARMRFPDTSLAKYIETYIMVQFNAVLSTTAHSQAPNSSFYSASWFGSPASSFSVAGSIAALDVLNPALSFVEPTTSVPTTSPSEPSAKPKRSLSIGAIVGGVVGGAITVFAIVTFLFMLRRHRRRDRQPRIASVVEQNHSSDPGSRSTVVADVEPFILPSSEDHSSKWSRFYAPRRDEAPSPSAMILLGAQGAARETTTGGNSDHAQGANPNRPEVASESPNSAELPPPVHHLYDLLQEEAELPPRYER
ncbi:hypothetical protein PENSPDRAFT_679489 [Peniophora sp. CONT]|nr:hypothetical protein PENSPDRAFT_679489 [Peniophora sp. CONT]